MLDQFTQPTEFDRYRLALPRFLRPQNGLRENILKTKTTFRGKLQRVPSDHLLVRLILSSGVPYKSDSRYYLDQVKDDLYDAAKAFNLTSEVSMGKPFEPGVFYGDGIKECIILHKTPFDIGVPWQDLSPIRIYDHPVTDLNMQPLDGGERTANGRATIAINYPMLLWMYQQWRHSDESVIDDWRFSTPHFVRMWLLTGLIDDHMDCVVVNRLYNDLFVLPDLGGDKRNAFFMADYGEELDRALGDWMNVIERKTLTASEMIRSIPLISGRSWQSLMFPPDIYTNAHVMWAYWSMWLKTIKLIVGLDYISQNRRNTEFHRDLTRWIERTQRSRWLGPSLNDYGEEMRIEFERLKELMA